MIMPSLISVIIPAYNHENYIRDAVQSVIAQDYPNIELIVIDDGSKDNTWSILKSLEDRCSQRFDRVLFITRPNQGVIKTCRELIGHAQGEFVVILASDDLLKPDNVSCLYDFLSQHPDYVMAVGDNDIVDANQQYVRWNSQQDAGIGDEFMFNTFKEYYCSHWQSFDFLSDDFGSYGQLLQGNHIPNGYMIRKSALDQVDAYNPAVPLEDWYLMLQLAKIGRFKFINRPLFSYRWHGANTAQNRLHMINVTQQTLAYEMRQMVTKEGASYLERILENKTLVRRKYYVHFGKVFSIYKIKFMAQQQYYVSLFGKNIFIRNIHK